VASLNALERQLALVGFMGAGKSTLAARLAERLDREVVSLDAEIERRAGAPVPRIFEAEGEDAFRRHESAALAEAAGRRRAAILDLGGGAATVQANREALARDAFTLLVDVDVDTAWLRCRTTDRPLARDERRFRALYEERRAAYREAADAAVSSDDVDGAILAAAGIHHELGALERLGELVPGDGPVALVADATVMGIHGPRAQEALGDRLASTHELPPGEAAKQLTVVERLWSELRIDRGGTVVALGGGAATDAAGFAAAAYLRGVAWVPVPTTVVGQVDAALGGKTAIDIPQGKNLVGAFHWPARVIVDESLVETLPERERRQGEAERLKTELLAGRPVDVRAAAAYKAALCLRDPRDRGPRNWLNLGHTFAHALEAAADFDLPHGEAVAIGLLAALRLSGRDVSPVVQALDPKPVRVDRERAWQALLRDKKRSGGDINLVLLGDDGPRLEARPADEVRAALDSLIA
jgi:shikimate kinase/3-dehydroquinate synthase